MGSLFVGASATGAGKYSNRDARRSVYIGIKPAGQVGFAWESPKDAPEVAVEFSPVRWPAGVKRTLATRACLGVWRDRKPIQPDCSIEHRSARA